MMESKNNRRSFIKIALTTVALTPVLKITDALAAAMPKSQKIKDKMIDAKKTKMLNYVADASEAKKLQAAGDKGYKKYTSGAMCDNCRFYTADKAEPEFGTCTMAARQYVSKSGWCKSYNAKK
jgi:hypothetical protein